MTRPLPFLGLNRRTFLGLVSLLLAGPRRILAGSRTEPLFLSAASDPDDGHWVKAFTLKDGVALPVFQHPLPARAHHIAVHQDAGLYVVVARRPGTWLMVGDLASGDMLRQITVPGGRHLYGHGVFSADGRRFYAVENDYRDREGDSGRVAVWEFSRDGGFQVARLHEFPSYGVGPHELLLMPDGLTLAVANGGIRTHPDFEREKLNLDTMQPSLVYVNAQTGALLEKRQLEPALRQDGIRHIDVNAAGQVALVMQYEGEPFDEVPLVGLHRRGEDIRLPRIGPEEQRRMKQYGGSVRFDTSGRYLAVSCPRGNLITFWDAVEGRYLNAVRSRDGCGVCAAGDGFLYTAGATGRINYYELATGESREFPLHPAEPLFWDNHLTLATFGGQI